MSDPTLTTSITQRPRDDGGAVVTLQWSLTNDLDEPILLFHLLTQRAIEPALVYHLVEGWRPGLLPSDDAPHLVIAKAVLAIQPGTAVYRPDVPLATELEPGSRFDEELSLHFPTRQHCPHRPFGAQQGLTQVTCRRLGFRIGYARKSQLDALDVSPEVMVADDAEVFRVPFEAALAAQQTLSSELVPCALTLML